mmetsp:Transcript_23093/g.46776  ORF Transcript_23093/g.46776 Transcript_23093/m.46776 type:complete len:431 (+) Transcript_23093:241-1533(+)|eukprot:CAMPEP_0181319796 /NCGR_PEP_ID=MMETSP1101-20121128/17768_1 /TAXON_ID=46948 /ORGANISM="Rhodomonas abbreviata, Strain Caron Lab Isolate" /LENGTH=430 /DNA_ID=CAMNT_0023427431 /DNA_START=240 /DNA_END=1532 /DNA_ORIENTATION=+
MCGPKGEKAARGVVGFVGFVFLLTGISLQFFSAGNLYGVPLEKLCEAYSGSEELSDARSFSALIQSVLDQRKLCLDLAVTANFEDDENREARECCQRHSPGGGPDDWILKGICAKPWLTNLDLFRETSEARILSPQEKMDLYTSVLGDFIGVQSAGKYYQANPEFWCKNCPDDYRKNCPFDPPKQGDEGEPVNEELCECPGGSIATRDTAFWAMENDHRLGSDFVKCSDKAKVYAAWLKALFPEWQQEELDHAEGRFNSKCWQGKGSLGYILTVGPVLAVLAGFFCGLAFIPILANSPVREIGFNLAMLAMALTLVAFWPLSFTGAASMASRYNFCAGLEYPIVHNLTSPSLHYRNAPVYFNGNPCYDINSNGEYMYNPFVKELGVFNSGYVMGGVLVVIALLCLLGVVSKASDVIMEQSLAKGAANREE